MAAIRVVIGSNGAGAGFGRGRGWAGTSMMLNKVTRATWQELRWGLCVLWFELLAEVGE